MKKIPNASPAPIASGIPLAPLSAAVSADEDTIATASSATTTPTSDHRPGRSPERRPKSTGTTAASTDVIGATTLIRPRARPRYNRTTPAPPATPAAQPHHNA